MLRVNKFNYCPTGRVRAFYQKEFYDYFSVARTLGWFETKYNPDCFSSEYNCTHGLKTSNQSIPLPCLNFDLSKGKKSYHFSFWLWKALDDVIGVLIIKSLLLKQLHTIQSLRTNVTKFLLILNNMDRAVLLPATCSQNQPDKLLI